MRMEKMAKNLGRLLPMLLLPLFTQAKQFKAQKVLAKIYPITSSSQTSYYLAGSLCYRFFI
jgi:hypothetical protein